MERFGFVPLTHRQSDDALSVLTSGVSGGGRVDLLLNNSGFGSEIHGADITATDNGTVNATMGSNSFSGGGLSSTYGLDGDTFAVSGAEPQACFDVGNTLGGNSFSSSPSGGAVRITKDVGTTFAFKGLGGVTHTAQQVEDLIVADNSPFVSGNVAVTGSDFTGAPCPLPTAP